MKQRAFKRQDTEAISRSAKEKLHETQTQHGNVAPPDVIPAPAQTAILPATGV